MASEQSGTVERPSQMGEKSPVDKRSALLDAAEAVLVERGVSKATIDEITTRAGVAKGTFYLYFASKDDVIGALQERLWGELASQAVAAVSRLHSDADWWETVDAFLETMVDYDLAHSDWLRAVAQGWVAPAGQEKKEQEFIDLIAAAIRSGVERGACAVDDPDLSATLLYRAVQGTSQQLCLAAEEIDRDRFVGALKTFVRRVLAPPP